MSFAKTSNQILIVEDEPLIAMDLEQALDQAGFSTELHTSGQDALNWLSAHTPVAAVLDVGLRGSSSEPVADALSSRNVPIVVYSGSEPSDVSPAFMKAKWIRKPSDPDIVAKEIEALVLGEFNNDLEQRG